MNTESTVGLYKGGLLRSNGGIGVVRIEETERTEFTYNR